MVVLWMVGCWWGWPASTNTLGILGRVTDAEGHPVVGLKVENLESSETTNEQGVFGLYYTAPDLHVGFHYHGGFYRRSYRPEDEGTRVEIALPEAPPGELDCGHFTCRVQLTWDLGPGFTFRHTPRCGQGRRVALEGLPAGLPSVTCKGKVTEPDVPLTLVRDADTLRLLPPERTVAVTVERDGTSSECHVWTDRHEATLGEDGRFLLPMAGAATVQATCDGRSAQPVMVGETATTAVLHWTSDGPSLQTPPGMELTRLQLRATDWVLEARAGRDGVFSLPPLPPGRYGVQLYRDALAPVPVEPIPQLEPGVIQGRLLASGVFAGELLLSATMGAGVLEIR